MPKRSPVTVATLATVTDHPAAKALVIACPRCGDQYSANAGDYFMRDANAPFRCHTCPGRPYLRLGHFVTQFHEVTV
jgi:predicted RNA-binding Zn-ribbon protein involved in translation (DUF1610 family)